MNWKREPDDGTPFSVWHLVDDSGEVRASLWWKGSEYGWVSGTEVGHAAKWEDARDAAVVAARKQVAEVAMPEWAKPKKKGAIKGR